MATMKRIILILFVACAVHAQTGLPTADNRALFYAEVKAVADSVAKKQDAYYKKYNRYFQGIVNTTTTKDITASLARFDRTLKPTDQKETWADFGLTDISVRGQYRIDVYDGPKGKGYVLSASIAYGTDVYTMSRNVGPETWRDTKLEFVKQAVAESVADGAGIKE
jgi:hypothetical protein